jgi:flagellar hook-associated protein 3 FlgL
MKATSVSSAGISNALRYSQMRMQVDLVNAQKELDSGSYADLGIALGARTSQSVTFSRDLDRLKTITDSNGLVTARLKSTQDALSQIADQAQTLLSSLTGTTSGDLTKDITRNSGKATLQSLTSILNTSINGEFLFAGTNTDVKPIDDYSAAGSPAKAAFDASFQANFGFSQDDPAAANITAAQMDDFLTNTVEPQFLGAGWSANWSSATDQPISSRIALNETTDASVSANIDGVRKLAMAATMVSELISGNISDGARAAVVSRAFTLVGESLASIGQVQSQTGIVQQRVTDASARMDTQVDLFKHHLLDLEGVDPNEAATRVNDLVSHIQTSFALTARIQQLSLLNFLTP